MLMAWSRMNSQWRRTGERVTPKALLALTLSICTGRLGSFICRVITDRPSSTFDCYPILFGFLVIGFLLNLLTLVLAFRERNDARRPIVAGSIAVAIVNATGFIWIFAATNGSPF